MKYSQITDPISGRTDRVSLLGLGCSMVGSIGNPAPYRQVEETLAAALELGVNHFDTADIYGQGDSERAIGRLLRGRRDRGFVVTKFGNLLPWKLRLAAPLKPVLAPVLRRRGAQEAAAKARASSRFATDFSPAHMNAALQASLRRLQTDYVDALLLHSPPPEAVLEPGLTSALAAAKDAGVIRHFGVSCDTDACLSAAVKMQGLSVVQVPLDVFERAGTTGLTRTLYERGIAVLLREAIRQRPQLTPVEAVSAATKSPGITSVVAGTSSPMHLRDLVAACN